MRVINLVNQDSGDIKYKRSDFPDGQHQITIDLNGLPDDRSHPIYIKSRINNFIDLELVNCTIASLKKARCTVIRLIVPYLLGSRSDIKFEEGSNNYLKDVLAPIINSWGLDEVTSMDPHSIAIENLINNYTSVSNEDLIRFVLNKEYGPDSKNWNNYRLVVPDNGAFKKLYKTINVLGYLKNPIICSKIRDLATGKLSITVVPKLTREELVEDIMLIDDICDGGRTFTTISEDIYQQSRLNNIMKGEQLGKRILVITHAMFSNGLDELLKHFDVIYCTNSYSDVSHPQVIQMNVF